MKYLLGIVFSIVAIWIVFAIGLFVARPKGLRVSQAARLLPNLVLLSRDLARDRSIPLRIRIRLWLLLAWMASPIDAIPDVIPVIGFADDVIIAYVVLRSVVRVAGRETLTRHWRGDAESLAALERLLRLDPGGDAAPPDDT